MGEPRMVKGVAEAWFAEMVKRANADGPPGCVECGKQVEPLKLRGQTLHRYRCGECVDS